MKLLSADDFRGAAKDGAQPEGVLFRSATTEPQAVGEDTRVMRFVFSDATIDHAGDSIDPKGWDLGIFKRNPVALFSHMSWEPPIGRASNVKVEGDRLAGDIEFASADVYEFADTIYRLVKGGFMKAVSVGFKPTKWVFTSDKDRPYGIDFQKQTLLEISICPVPCNPNALNEARSLGLDTKPLQAWAEKVLDSGDVVFMPRKDVEALRSQAAGAPAVRYYIQSDTVLSPAAADRAREAVKSWIQDPNKVLVLGPGVSLRTIGEQQHSEAPVERPAPSVAPVVRAGRRISAANKAKLDEAMGHHAAMGKCIESVMGPDAQDGDEGDDGDDGDEETEALDLDDNGGTPTPDHVAPDEPYKLSPEQRRLKEARDLKASLLPID